MTRGAGSLRVDDDVTVSTGGTTVELDNFDRTGPDLGNASSGPAWLQPTGYPTNGVVTGQPGGGNPHLPTPALVGNETTLSWRLRTSHPIPSIAGPPVAFADLGVSSANTPGGYGSGNIPTHPAYFVEIEFTNQPFDASGLTGAGLPQLSIWGGDDINDPGSTTAYAYAVPNGSGPNGQILTMLTNTWYVVKFHILWGVLAEAKIWEEGTTEPVYQVSTTLIFDANSVSGGPDRPSGAYTWFDIDNFGTTQADDLADTPVGGGGTTTTSLYGPILSGYGR